MAKLYKRIAILSMMIVAFNFTACGGDDEDVDNGIQKPPIASLTKRLIKVSMEDRVYNYTYDNDGRLKEIRLENNYSDHYSTFTYKENKIIEDIVDSRISFQEVYTLENGRVVEWYDGDTEQIFSLTYDNGYLVSMATKKEDTQYNWSDGNLLNVTRNGKIVEKYEYSNIKAPEGFFPFVLREGKIGYWGVNFYLGKTMKNLPSKYVEGAVEKYDWTIQDGLPIKMIRTVNDSYIKTFTFEWI